jgi:hypothetical protein
MSRRTPALARLVLLALALTGLVRADMTTGSAFQAGKDAAAGGSAATGSINGTGAAGNVPGYTTNPDAGNFWANGKASLTGNGLGKQAGCTTSSTSGFGGQECNAINFLGGSRPGYPLEKNDALFNLSNGITKDNRDKVAGLDGGTGTGGCTVLEVKDPDLQSTEHCEEWLEPTDNSCTVGRVVKVDRDANYQCEVTTAQTAQHECHETLTLACTGWGNPTCTNPGNVSVSGYTWGGRASAASVSTRMSGADLIIRLSGVEYFGSYWSVSNYANIKSIKITASSGIGYDRYGYWGAFWWVGAPEYYRYPTPNTEIKANINSYPILMFDPSGSGWVELTVVFNSPSCTYACTNWQETWVDGCTAYKK